MSCGCLCGAMHVERGICDVEAPEALLTIGLAGSALAEFTQSPERDVLMCQPCAEATAACHPRVRGVVLLGE